MKVRPTLLHSRALCNQVALSNLPLGSGPPWPTPASSRSGTYVLKSFKEGSFRASARCSWD